MTLHRFTQKAPQILALLCLAGCATVEPPFLNQPLERASRDNADKAVQFAAEAQAQANALKVERDVIVANRWQRKWDIASQKYLLVVEQWNKEIEARLDYEEHFEAGHTQDCQLLLDRVAEDYSLDADQREDLIDGMNDLIDTHEMSIEEFNEALQAFFLPNNSPGLSDDESAAFRRIVEGFGPEPT